MWPGRKLIVRKAHGLCSSFESTCKFLTKRCTEWGSYLELEPPAWVSLFIAVSFLSYRCLWPSKSQYPYRVFSHDVTAAILVSQNNETAAMLMSQTNPLGVELFSYANAFFFSINLRRCRPREWKHSIQILQTAGLLYFFLKNELKEFDKRSKHFLLGDHFINSHSVISWHCMDIVRRKWVAHWNTSFPSMDFLSIWRLLDQFTRCYWDSNPCLLRSFWKLNFLFVRCIL